mgnify:CR=1 FL=1
MPPYTPQPLSDEQRQQARQAAAEADAALHITQRSEPWQHLAFKAPNAAHPALHLDDASGIPFLQDIVGIENYQLRAVTRATDGDLIVGTCAPMPDYLGYHAQTLGLGKARYLHAPIDGSAIEVAKASQAPQVLDPLCQAARDAGGLTIHPYMGIKPVWELAKSVADTTHTPVQVLAPPPPVTWYANDKLLLHKLVHGLLGPRWLVDTHHATTAAELAGHLRTLAAKHRRVALKMTRCASAMGNRLWTADQILAMDDSSLLNAVQTFLKDKEWRTDDPVVAVSWEDATDSPSSQLWIPPKGQGQPRLDGLYEQLLEGEEGVFQGSLPSRLSQDVHQQMAFASLMIAEVYQALGYVGRCSFDFIVVDGQVKFVECNGRWGGTSTPMSLVDRLYPDGRPPYRVRDVILPHLIGHSFQDVLDALGDDAWRPNNPQGRFVLYNVGSIRDYGKLDVVAFGKDLDDAELALEERFMERVEALR